MLTCTDARPVHTTLCESGQGLDKLPAGFFNVFEGVYKCGDATDAVRCGIDECDDASYYREGAYEEVAQPYTCDKHHDKCNTDHHGGITQVTFEQDESGKESGQKHGGKKSFGKGFDIIVILGEFNSHEDDEGELGQLGRLEPGKAQVKPALAPVNFMAYNQHRYQGEQGNEDE